MHPALLPRSKVVCSPTLCDPPRGLQVRDCTTTIVCVPPPDFSFIFIIFILYFLLYFYVLFLFLLLLLFYIYVVETITVIDTELVCVWRVARLSFSVNALMIPMRSSQRRLRRPRGRKESGHIVFCDKGVELLFCESPPIRSRGGGGGGSISSGLPSGTTSEGGGPRAPVPQRSRRAPGRWVGGFGAPEGGAGKETPPPPPALGRGKYGSAHFKYGFALRCLHTAWGQIRWRCPRSWPLALLSSRWKIGLPSAQSAEYCAH